MANYLYNGVELPEIPEWDKTAYPYAVIYHWGAENSLDTAMVVLIVSTQPITYFAQTNTHVYSTIKAPTLSWRVYSENIENYNAWTTWLDGTNAIEIGDDNLIWANHDLVIGSINTLFAPKPTEWAVGDLVLAASDPVPVGGDTPEYAIIPTADYKAICDAIRAKTGKTDLIKSGDMASEIASIESGSGGGEPYEGNPYLTFSSANAFTIATGNSSKNWNGTLYYSTDTETWNEWDGTAAIESAEHNGEQSIYMRGVRNAYLTSSGSGSGLVLSGDSIECNGNIETLLDCESVAAGDHPVMGHYCYAYMFKGCTALTTAPELPATTLAAGCYNFMFNGCTSLTTAPTLPATTLTISCYSNMFNGCTSLATAPALPATTLADYCYSSMFKDCTALITAPELPATTLITGCYSNMFNGCTSLTTAPELHATTLADYCCNYMFKGCTALTTAPELHATTLADYCYSSMFDQCTSLVTAPELPATTLSNYCYNFMFNGCTSLATAPTLPATTLSNWCYSQMFQGCTSLTTAPALPATTLADYCYNAMFKSCTSLNTVPALPATTLFNCCYYYMFYGCTSLKFSKTSSTTYKNSYRIPKSGTGTNATNWNYSMFTNTSGTFTSSPSINTTYYTSNTVV